MSQLFQFTRRGLALAALMVLVGCSATYRNHGYTPTDVELQEINVGSDTRESVEEAVGRPAASGVLRDSGWYYVSSQVKSFGWKEPEVVDRQVVAISFNTRGTVTNIERFSLEDGRVVALSRRVTESNIKGLSFIGQLLKNFGRFDVGQALGG